MNRNPQVNIKRINTAESHARRVLARIGSNPVTWLQHQVEKAKDVSPETLAHIRGLFKKLVKKHGRLKSIPDEIAEREYIRIAYRLNFMRTLEALYLMKPGGQGHHTVTKTLAVWAAATLKYKSSNGKSGAQIEERKRVPAARRGQTASGPHEGDDGALPDAGE